LNFVTQVRPRLPGFRPHPRALTRVEPGRPTATPRGAAGIAAAVSRLAARQRRKTGVP